jgi:putative spermidine/putrescine transport system substrate-binding protein
MKLDHSGRAVPRPHRRGRRALGRALGGTAVAGGLVLSLGLATGAGAAATSHGAALARPTAHYPKSLHGAFAFYSGGDTNVASLWQDVLIPSFNRLYPNVKIDYVLSEHGADDVTTLDRVAVAVKDHKPSGYALLESGTNAVELAARQRLFIPVTTSAIPNAANIPKATMQVVDNDAVPYRGSKVVLAYNSKSVTNPPKTLSQLLSWIQAHPGQFAYCNPSGGGSGQYFVEDVLDSYMPAKDVQTLAFDDDTALESEWSKGMAELHAINGDVYGGGTYPTGNTQVLSLLASGAVQMATVWSDQGTSALQSGQLPSSVKLTDITPAFAGSPVYLGVPKYTPKNQVILVDAFLNFVLSVPQQAKVVKYLAGFPAISLSMMTSYVKNEFSSLGESESLPYAAPVVSDMERIWQQDVP